MRHEFCIAMATLGRVSEVGRFMESLVAQDYREAASEHALCQHVGG